MQAIESGKALCAELTNKLAWTVSFMLTKLIVEDSRFLEGLERRRNSSDLGIIR
jgi:hypothetical protein